MRGHTLRRSDPAHADTDPAWGPRDPALRLNMSSIWKSDFMTASGRRVANKIVVRRKIWKFTPFTLDTLVLPRMAALILLTRLPNVL